MAAIAEFDYNQFIRRYPEFSSVDSDVLYLYWVESTLYHRNDGIGPILDPAAQALLLNMITAHIAQLNLIRDGQAQSELVGRISNASEGSVSVAAVLELPPTAQAQWFGQTKYGLAYWSATANYRQMRYYPGPRRNFNPLYGGGPFPGFIVKQ